MMSFEIIIDVSAFFANANNFCPFAAFKQKG